MPTLSRSMEWKESFSPQLFRHLMTLSVSAVPVTRVRPASDPSKYCPKDLVSPTIKINGMKVSVLLLA